MNVKKIDYRSSTFNNIELRVSQTKEGIDLAIGAWGNYGPVEVNNEC